MSKGDKFRLKTPSVAIIAGGGYRLMVTIPWNAVVEIVGSSPNEEQMVDVRWENRNVLMLLQDIRERAHPLIG